MSKIRFSRTRNAPVRCTGGDGSLAFLAPFAALVLFVPHAPPGVARAVARQGPLGVYGPVLGAGTLGAGRAWVWEADSGIYVTADSGAHWKKVTPYGSGDPANVLGVEFLNAERAWAAIAVPDGKRVGVKVWRTEDGGKGWTAVRLPSSFPTGYDRAYLDFLPAGSGFVLVQLYHRAGSPGKGNLFYTANWGATWSEVDAAAPVDAGIWFTSAHDGFGTDAKGTLWNTGDGGKQWIRSA